ncbi:hypothetical protein LK10_12805 [Sinomonas humi]|uniref:HTH tetR-type domain-containing protein n=2 Tax=Sinomonas humi TaxID=1338436 RepID=A0A0B2AKY0_9MICC|nr:hypothetical protein LK10_12805 [Sinomonas humi]
MSRESILAVAADLFSRQGYRATSLQDVADRFGVQRPALYYWFPRKVDILIAIHDPIITSLTEELDRVAALDVDADEKLTLILASQVKMYTEKTAELAVYLGNEAELPEKQRAAYRQMARHYQLTIETIYRDGVEAGLFEDLDPKMATASLLGMVQWLHRWYHPSGRYNADQVMDTILSIARHGIRRNNPSDAVVPTGAHVVRTHRA